MSATGGGREGEEGEVGVVGDLIEQEMRAVVAAHNEECGARAEQLMVDGRLYPQEIEAWADEVERLRLVEAKYEALRDQIAVDAL